jgi:FdhD protein
MQIGSSIKVHRYNNQKWRGYDVPEMLEQSVSLSVNGKIWLSFLCLPENLENLAIGFLFTEGIIQDFDEVVSSHLCENNSLIDIWLSHPAKRPRKWIRSSGCAGGMTRGLQIDSTRIIHSHKPIQPACISNAMKQLYAWQLANYSVKGLHCSALFDENGLLHASHDVGRHNTLDKIAGMLLKSHKMGSYLIAVTTGRITSEMLTKCARMGTCLVISRTTPSQLAVKMAQSAGITLVGHAQDDTFNVFSHPEIIFGHPDCPKECLESDLLSVFPQHEFYPQEC